MLPWQLDISFQPTFFPSWWEMQTSGPGGTFSFCSNLVLISPPLAFNSFYKTEITCEVKCFPYHSLHRTSLKEPWNTYKNSSHRTQVKSSACHKPNPSTREMTKAAVWTHPSCLTGTRVRIQPHRRAHTAHQPPAFCEPHLDTGTHSPPAPSILWATLSTAQLVKCKACEFTHHLGAGKGGAKCQQLRKYTDHTYKCPAWKERQGWWTHIKTKIILNGIINNLFLRNFQKNSLHEIHTDIP